MEVRTRAVELAGEVDAKQNLHLDDPIPLIGPTRVRVIILFPDESDFDERVWLHAAATNPVFDFLSDPAEDIYSLEDGEAIDGKR